MSQGAIFLHREITEHWLWKDKPFSKGQAWVDMILLANHTENKVPYNDKVTVISRGEFIRSERFLAMRWGWSKASVHRFLILLKNDSMIDIKSNQKANQISILNYNEYQEMRTKKEPKVNQKRTKSEPVVNLNNNEEECIKNDNIYVDFFSTPLMQRFLNHRKKKAPILPDSYEFFYNKFMEWEKEGYSPEIVVNTMIDRGWRSFKSEWMDKNGKANINQGNGEGNTDVFGKYLAEKYK